MIDKIIELFNTPQADLTYIDQLIMALIMVIPITIVLAIVYFVCDRRK